MKKRMIAFALLFAVIAATAHAGPLGRVSSWLTLEAVAFALSAVVAVIGGALGIAFKRVSHTFKEVGEFLTALGSALEDQRLTREELADIINEGRDIFAIW